jgi:hypothetical protein
MATLTWDDDYKDLVVELVAKFGGTDIQIIDLSDEATRKAISLAARKIEAAAQGETECDEHRTNSNVVVFENDEENPIYFVVSEHYTIIDPHLPYKERFKTRHYVIEMHGEEGPEVSAIVSSGNLHNAGMMLLNASDQARRAGL